MASPTQPPAGATAAPDVAAYLDMPPERRVAAKAHAAGLTATAGKVALELPLGADVDDFRRVLIAQATTQVKP
jgi:glucose-6-phosphate 1-dehydrogenase